MVYSIKGNLNHVIADYNQAIAIVPDHALAYFNRGWVYAEVNLPGASEGKLCNFISRACPPDSSRGDCKEKANRSMTLPYAGLAGPFPPAASSGVPWLFPMEEREKAIADLELAAELGLDPRTEQTTKTLLDELRE